MAQSGSEKAMMAQGWIWKNHDGAGVDLKKPRHGAEQLAAIWQKQYYCLLFSIYISPNVPVLYSTFFGFFFAVFSFACKEIIELTF